MPHFTISDGGDMPGADVTEKVRGYIVDNFLYTRPDFALGEDDALLGNGIIDSMGVMEVIMFLEEVFGVTVNDADITEENLGTVRAIASYVLAHPGTARIRRTA
jgi:acyl carrier protein